MRAIVIGCGYVGLPLCVELARQGHEVFGVQRSGGAAAALTRAGVIPLRADITKPAELARLPSAPDWVVDCVASGGGGPDQYARVYRDGMRNLLGWLAPLPPGKFVYTSSTSVYAQTDGSLVDERSATEPLEATGQILLETEGLLLKDHQERGFAGLILRLAGIYGPGRGYWLKQFLHGTARLDGDGSRWLNMVHRDDVVGALIAALERGRPGEVYNLVDDEPVAQRALYEWLSARLQRPLPESMVEDSSDPRKRGASNKRVSNRKLKNELAYQFKYPTFREGFEAELTAQAQSAEH